jgi:hypothetical protein
MNEIKYVQLVRTDKNEIWLFQETEQGWKPYRQIKKDIIEGEIVAESKEAIEKVADEN